MELIETSIFTRQITALLGDEDYGAFQSRLAANPGLGARIKGGGGITQECKAAGVKLFPSWQFGANKPIEGVFPLEELSDKTGCSLP